MKALTYAAAVLAVIAGTAPAMAQYVQPAAPDAPVAVQAQPPLNAQELVPGANSATDMRGQPGGMFDAYGQPNQVYGIPGAGQASGSSHPAPQ
jgi:hypothetical protein